MDNKFTVDFGLPYDGLSEYRAGGLLRIDGGLDMPGAKLIAAYFDAISAVEESNPPWRWIAHAQPGRV